MPIMNKNRKVKEDTEKIIIYKYTVEKKSTITISKELGYCVATIRDCLIRNNIKRRSYSESKRTYTINENYFNQIDSSEKAYFLGFLYGDGNNFPEKNTISIASQESDSPHLQKFHELIGSNKKIKLYKTHINTINALFCINNKQISQDLIKLGVIKNKTYTLKFPFFLEKKYYKDFIRGLFDSDGNFSYYNIVSKRTGTQSIIANFSISSTKDMANSINDIFSEFLGIPKTKMKIDKRLYENNGIYRCGSPSSMIKIYDFLYKDATVFLERKKQKFEKFFSLRKIKFLKINLKNDQ